MSEYLPPNNIEPISIFNPANFETITDYLTIDYANKHYLKYPYAQGTENLRNITISGSVGQKLPGLTDCAQFGDSASLKLADATATFNSCFGVNSGVNIISGNRNTLIGASSGTQITSSNQITAIGAFAMNNCDSVNSTNNTCVGYRALQNIKLAQNCAFGVESMLSAGQSQGSTSFGFQNMYSQTDVSLSNANTSMGYLASYTNITGGKNASFGYRSLYSNTSFENSSFGSLSLENNSSGSRNSAFGFDAGRYNLGSSNNYFGVNTGQLPADTTAYTYLTCIGRGAGRDAGTCANSRFVFGSTTGNETYFFAGNTIFDIRDNSRDIQLFPNQTSGDVIIGNPTGVGGSELKLNSANGDIKIGGTNTTTAGIFIGNSLTTGDITIGNSTATDGGALKLYSSDGDITIGGTNTTNANINIGNSLTGGNITLGNSSAGGGEIFLNRSINLPPTTSWTIPSSGQLGYTTAIPITVTTNASTGQATLPSPVSNITQFSQPFNFPEKGVFLVNCWFGMMRSGSTGGVTTRIGISANATSCPDVQNTVNFYTGNTNGLKINPITLLITMTITNTSTNYYITGNTGLATTTDAVTLGDALVYITRIA